MAAAEYSGRRESTLLVMGALVLAEAVASFEASMIYAALASFYRVFGDPIAIGWLVTGYMLVATATAAICARLGDIYGRKRVLLICLALAGAGSLLSAATTSLPVIIAGRACQGFAGAILPLCYGMVREYLPPGRVALNIGIVSATASGGAGVGLVVGGLLVDFGSWRAIFIASAALALIAIAAVWLFVPRRMERSPARIDWLGGVLFVPGLCLLLYALGLGEEHGWGSPVQLAWLAGGLAFLATWVFHELRIEQPLIDVRMAANRQIGLTMLIFFLMALGTMNLGQIVMVMLQQPVSTGVGMGLSATFAGLLHSPASVVGTIASPLCGWYAGRKGSRNAMILATAAATIAWIGLAAAHGNVWIVFGWLLLNSFALGAAMAAAPNLIVEAAPAGRTSEATGLAQIARKIGMAVGAQLVAISMATSTVEAGGGVFPAAEAYLLTYGWVALACMAALLVAACLPRRAPGLPLESTAETQLETGQAAAH